MKKSQKVESVKGIRTGYLFFLILVVFCFLCIAIFGGILQEKAKYRKLISDKNQYNQCITAVTELQQYSGRLTQYSRAFVETQETEYLMHYFNDVSAYKTRKSLLQTLEQSTISDSFMSTLRIAENEAERIAETEFYSMKLVCDAINLNSELIPDALDSVELTSSDKNLSFNEKINKARELLFNENYIFAQMNVTSETNSAVNNFLESNLQMQTETQKEIEKFFKILIQIVVFIIISAVITYLIFLFQVYFPLRKSVASIEAGVHINPVGSYEVQYIAKAYNNLCDKNQITASVLKHKAEHDPLTGLINRGGFDQIKSALSESAEPIAYLLIDIDLFKQINDKYGHAAGDDVLRKISNLLMEQFRNSDYVARIGGDEFAVIMTKFGDSPVEIINTKIRKLNAFLQNNNDGLPPVSLSVGVSFSQNGFIDEMEKQADQALYKVKKGGRCNCSFFMDEE